MLNREIGQKFIKKIYEKMEIPVDVIDEKGVVLASFDSKFFGSFYKPAYDLIRSRNRKEELTDGIILVVKEEERRVGVIKIHGKTEILRPVIDAIGLTMEVMLECENQYEQFQKYNRGRDIFDQALLYGNNISQQVLESRARVLGILPEAVRVPIFVVVEPKKDFTQLIQSHLDNPMASEQDIVTISRSGRIVIFKTLDQEDKMLAEYRFAIEEYLKWWTTELQKLGEIKIQYNIGTIQNKLIRYKEAYQHAVWLVTSAKCEDPVNWFYEHTHEYFRSLLSMDVYKSLFSGYVCHLEENIQEYLPELIDALEACNYNFVKASEKLFVHKNTTAFRMDKIRNYMNVDPVKKSRDRNFMADLSYYLKQDIL